MKQATYSDYAAGYGYYFGEPNTLMRGHHQMGAMSGRQALENVLNSAAFKQWEGDLKNRGRQAIESTSNRQGKSP